MIKEYFCTMGKESMHKSFEVIYKEVDECPVVDWQLTFFQLVYVVSGTGTLKINGNRMPYSTGNLMLLTPNDYHHFDISTTTAFLLIRFNSGYIKEYQWESIDHIECLLYYATDLLGCILKCKSDEFLVRSISESILHGISHNGLYNEDLTRHFVNALIVIAARNIAMIRPANLKANADKRILEIINYIQLNICCPQKLKAPVIAEEFGVSDTYLGRYFKSQCGETIQHFISNYKVRLIEHRLRFSDKRINEIADEFGFSDESHLNKFFKKHRNLSLTGYRRMKSYDEQLPSIPVTI